MQHATESLTHYRENFLALCVALAHHDLLDRAVVTRDSHGHCVAIRRLQKLHQQAKRLHLVLVFSDRTSSRFVVHTLTMVADQPTARNELYR